MSHASQIVDVQRNPRWYAVWTRSHCEQLVSDQLATHGFTVFLPKVTAWTRTPRGRTKIDRVLFPGYLFVHEVMDKPALASVLQSRGVVRVLGQSWDQLSAVPDDEMKAVQRMVAPSLGAFAHPVPQSGDRVRIVAGPLQGLEGRFIRAQETRGVFVVSVTLLHRSVAVALDADQVEAA
jgi:transcription antitermination factor NusG